MRRFAADLREGARGLLQQPRFLAIASLTLALGIAAVTTIFSVVNAVLLKPLPYPDGDRLVNVWSSAPGLGYDQFPLSPDLFDFYRQQNTVFAEMALFQARRVNLTEGGRPEVADALVTTHGYFETYGVRFTAGRSYTADEDRPEAARVAVVSHRLWTRRYGADRTLVGRTVRVDGQPTTILGVAPAWLDEPGSPDVWLPARFDPKNPPVGNFGWNAVARLKPGVTPEAAAAQLFPLVRRAMEDAARSEAYRAFLRDGQYRPLVRPVYDDLVRGVREPLWILLGTVILVLLVACGNVASLCLIRADGRQREMALRMAMGASRWSLIRRQLAEALVLSTVATVLGVLAAAVALPLLVRFAPPTIPRLDRVTLDLTVFAFASAAAVVSALFFGIGPALRYTRPDVLAGLRQGGRSATDGPGRQRGRQLLVVAQTAAALVLLVSAGLLARSFSRLMDAELGFVPADVLTFRVALPPTVYPKAPEIEHFELQLLDRLTRLPGVDAAGAASALPIAAFPDGTAFEMRGRPVPPGKLPPIVSYQTVTAGFFDTLRIPVTRGRDFDATERRDDVRSVIVNEAAAREFWPNEDVIGRQLRPADEDAPPDRPWFTVVGVVKTVRQGQLRDEGRPQFYFPLSASADNAPAALTYAIRGPAATGHADAIRRAVWALDPELPVAAVQTLDEVVARSVVQFSFTMLTLAIAAGVSLVLGAVGLYGVLSYAVGLRTREIGVRLALGAPTGKVMRSVVTHGIVVTLVGLVTGSLGAAAATRLLGGLLYEVEPFDALTFAAMPLVLLVVAVVASYLPARRAAAVSPLEAMRAD